jgi:thioredoxin-like negative regulator of GroEL
MISRITGIAASAESGETEKANGADSPSAMLLFFTRRTSGPARRMASLVAWVEAREKRRLRVVEVDADENAGLAERLLVSDVPALVLVKDRRAVGRLQGRVTGVQIERLIDAHLAR